MRKKMKDKGLLIVSILAAIAGCFLSMQLFEQLPGFMNTFMKIGIEIGILFICIAVAATIYSKLTHYHITLKHLLCTLLAFVTITGVGSVFEYIYELDLFKDNITYNEPTSYIFIMDVSGSMATSDPAGTRFDAIQTIMNDKDENFPYAIYSFSNSLEEIRALAPKCEDNSIHYNNNGGTAIKGTLKNLFKMYKNGTLGNVGEHPKFLFLSDGAPTDMTSVSEINSVLNNYLKSDLVISTVGFGAPYDELMETIATRTGGVYVKADNVANIEASMQNAINNTSNNRYARTLLSYRFVPEYDWVYRIERLVFMFILGFMITFALHKFTTGRPEDFNMVWGIMRSLLASILLEFGINSWMMEPSTAYLIYSVLVGMIIVRVIKRPKIVKEVKVVEPKKEEKKYTQVQTPLVIPRSYGALGKHD